MNIEHQTPLATNCDASPALARASGSADRKARLIRQCDAAWATYYRLTKACEKARERMAGAQWKAEDFSRKVEAQQNTQASHERSSLG